MNSFWKMDLWGMYTTLFYLFIFSDVVLQDKKIFCQCYQNYRRHLWLHFSYEWKVVSLVPQMGGCTPPINLEVFFRHISHDQYGLKTWYAQSCRHVDMIKKVLRHIQHFWRSYDFINVRFFLHLQMLFTYDVIDISLYGVL